MKRCGNTVQVPFDLRRISSARSAGSAVPGGDGEDAMLLTKIARCGRDDRAFSNHELSTGLNGKPNIFFADKAQRRRVC